MKQINSARFIEPTPNIYCETQSAVQSEESTHLQSAIPQVITTSTELHSILPMQSLPQQTTQDSGAQEYIPDHQKFEFQPAQHIPALQRALLEHIIPVWESALKDDHNFGLIEQFFYPDSFSFASPVAGEVALSAYSVILSLPLTDYSIHFLVRLVKAYPVDVLREAVFSRPSRAAQSRGAISWEDCVRNVAAIPPKVANALGARGASIPTELEQGTYFSHLSVRCERMIYKMSKKYSRGQ